MNKEDLDKIKRILLKISRGEGAYSQDRLTHAGNCVESMKGLAREALALFGEECCNSSPSREKSWCHCDVHNVDYPCSDGCPLFRG